MKTLIRYSIISLILISFHASGAPQGDFKYLYGKILDAETKEEIYLASIRLVNTNLSNVSNSDGIFSLKIPSSIYSEEDSIQISYLGYNSTKISVKELNKTGKSIRKIYLDRGTYALNAAVIRSMDPISIFNKAIKEIDNNYHTWGVAMSGFYREMVRRGNNTYLALNEAILDINKKAYKSFATDEVGIYKGRGSVNRNKEDTLLLKLQGGPTSSLLLDVMKDPFIAVYSKDVEHFYDFSLGPYIIINDRAFYTLNFNQKNSNDILYRGKMYVDCESFAVARIEFKMNLEDKERANRLFIKKKPKNIKLDVNSASYIVNYTQSDGRWYFDYSRVELKLESRKKGKLFSKLYTIISELAITDYKSGEFEIDKLNKLRSKDIISNKITDFTDDNFWEDYNIIEPDESIENVIRKIIRQMKRRRS